MRARFRSMLVAFTLALGACASGPVPPDWQASAHSAMKDTLEAYLRGDSHVAAIRLADARREIARSGRPDLMARAELVHCAARVASLEFDDCPGYSSLAGDAGREETAYSRFLAGAWQPGDVGALPAHYRSLPTSATAEADALAAIDDPAARLIAAGVLFRVGRLGPGGVALARETASANGWRRPLLAWLGIELRRAEVAADGESAARIRRRIELVTGPAARAGRGDPVR